MDDRHSIGGAGRRRGRLPIGPQNPLIGRQPKHRRRDGFDTGVTRAAASSLTGQRLRTRLLSTHVTDREADTTAQANFLTGLEAEAPKIGAENLFIDPEFADWSNGISSLPAMYAGMVSAARTAGGVAGAYCAAITSASPNTFYQDVYFSGTGGLTRKDFAMPSGDGDGGVMYSPLCFSFYVSPGASPSGVVRPYIDIGGVVADPLYGEDIALTELLPNTWHRYCMPIPVSLVAAMTFLRVGLYFSTSPLGSTFLTDGWQLERGEAPTAWKSSTRQLRLISWSPSKALNSTSYAAIDHPGGSTFGIAPPLEEDWVVLGLNFLCDTPNYSSAGQTISAQLQRDGSTALITAVATNPATLGTAGQNDRSKVVDYGHYLQALLKRSWTTGLPGTESSDWAMNAKVLVLPR